MVLTAARGVEPCLAGRAGPDAETCGGVLGRSIALSYTLPTPRGNRLLQEPPLTAIEPGLPLDPQAPAASAEWAVARRDAVAALSLDERVAGLLTALDELDEILADVSPEALTHELIDESELEVIEEDADSEADAFIQAEGKAPEQLARADTIVLSGPEVRRKIRAKQSIMPSHMAGNLYQDVRALFEIGDREGALVSLERLIVVAPIAPQIESFLSHNEARLLDYYHNVFGPFTRVLSIPDEGTNMPDGYFRMSKVATVWELVNGDRTVQELIDLSGLRTIEACAVISQLVRAAAVNVSPG